MKIGIDDQGRLTATLRAGQEIVIIGESPTDTVVTVHQQQATVDDIHHVTVRCEGINQ